jgi:hypothetical protein
MSAIEQIKALVELDDPFTQAPDNLAELQLEAVRERFHEKRQQIKILDRRASEAGIDEINSLQDIVPLLFTHTNYKSYPEAFVDNGKWGHMNVWLQTLSSTPVTGVDLEGVQTADDWIARLADAGHHLFASSGTSGKCSFLNQTADDVALALKAYEKCYFAEWLPFKPNKDRSSFVFFPPTGVHRLCGPSNHFFSTFASPEGECHFISDEPLRAHPGIRAGQLRRALAAGTALPDEVAAFEAENARNAEKAAKRFDIFVDKIQARLDKPLAFGVMWPAAFQVMEALKARGVKPGSMHPETIFVMGGGIKGVKLPDDHRQQIYDFFGVPKENFLNTYGMVEMTGLSPYRHNLDAYVLPPWIVPLVLDKPAENLLNPTAGRGQVEGRMALFDLLTDARWGGLISGDKVTVDFDSAEDYKTALVRSVARYQDLEEGEDKLTCAGTIDSYVRGAVNL